MITEVLLTMFFGIADIVLTILPDFQWEFDGSLFAPAREILSMIAYLLPWDTVISIVSMILRLTGLRVGIATVLTILKFIPFL